jgi:hypothetical protein
LSCRKRGLEESADDIEKMLTPLVIGMARGEIKSDDNFPVDAKRQKL